MKIEIKAEKTLTASRGARLLSSIALLRDALAIETEEQVSVLTARLEDITYGETSAASEVRQLGMDLLHARQLSQANRELNAVIIQELLAISQDNGVRLISLSQGSAIGIIKEGIKRIRQRLKQALSATPSLLPEKDTSRFKNTVLDMLKATTLVPSSQELVLGCVVISSNIFREVTADMEAYKIEIASDEDDEEEAQSESASASW